MLKEIKKNFVKTSWNIQRCKNEKKIFSLNRGSHFLLTKQWQTIDVNIKNQGF